MDSIHGMETIWDRWLTHKPRAALKVLPVVVLTGARQTGKTTLAEALLLKASQQVTPSDADGIAAFRQSLGKGRRFQCGAVLHAGSSRSLGQELWALPWRWLVPQAEGR